jgi:hypothetical protein
MLAHELRLERPRAIARDLDPDRPLIGQHPLAARAMPMIGGEVRLGGTGWVAEVIRPLAAQRPLNQRLLKRREAVSISSAVSGPSRTS